MKAVIIWGSQLTIEHNSALQAEPKAPVIIIESPAMCRKFPFHKQKLRFILTAMRDFADELRASGRTVWYYKFEDCLGSGHDTWTDQLAAACKQHKVDALIAMRLNDRPPQTRLEAWCKQNGISLETTPNNMFLTPSRDFEAWANDQNRLLLESFYRWQRKRLGILMQQNGKPQGGSWNYDAENRKPLPKKVEPPDITLPKPSKHAVAVEALIKEHFDDNPGSLDDNWLPTNRPAARRWLKQFLDERFSNFGDYEDAMRKSQTFLYHSALSAMMNIGLLHPREIVDAALAAEDIPLAGREGFIRQIIGWREFMFGLYHHKPADWIESNYLEQRKQLPEWWWQLDAEKAPEPPLADALARLSNYGYSHHIERLMVFGNYMLLADYDPKQVYRWFMSMYVDAYEWVMVPNVIGMSQFADGGLDNGGFASKPYISGSNYLQKMGGWWQPATAAKDSEWTGMYWDFLLRHEDKIGNNFRLRPLYKQAHSRRG